MLLNQLKRETIRHKLFWLRNNDKLLWIVFVTVIVDQMVNSILWNTGSARKVGSLNTICIKQTLPLYFYYNFILLHFHFLAYSQNKIIYCNPLMNRKAFFAKCVQIEHFIRFNNNENMGKRTNNKCCLRCCLTLVRRKKTQRTWDNSFKYQPSDRRRASHRIDLLCALCTFELSIHPLHNIQKINIFWFAYENPTSFHLLVLVT